MAELFSDEWMQGFMAAWNAEPDLVAVLSEVGFNATVGYGFEDEAQPRGVIRVANGAVVSAAAYGAEALDWDIRCSETQWKKWLKNPPGMMGLGMAFTSGKLKFRVGDYTTMLKDARMADPFIKSFAVMGKVG